MNCSPVVAGNLVYIGHGETNSDSPREGRIVCLDGSVVKDGKPKLVWKKDGIRVKFASPILDKERLYVCSDTADLFCLNATTGKQIWKLTYGKNAKGSPLLADGKIYVGTVDGQFQIIQPGETEGKILHTHSFEGAQVKGKAIAVNGKVYFMTTTDTYCLGKKNHTAKADPIPAPVPEPPLGPNPNRRTCKSCPPTSRFTLGKALNSQFAPSITKAGSSAK